MAQQTELDAIVVELKIEITQNPEAAVRQFHTFNELKEYFADEVTFWNTVSIPAATNAFQEILTPLRQAEQDNVTNARDLIGQARNLANRNMAALIHSSTSLAKFLKELTRRDSGQARAAFEFIRGEQDMQTLLNSRAAFSG
ncbi:MAG: hypothetical protein ABSE57_24335, partial [Bryobacteraceae bacterium]